MLLLSSSQKKGAQPSRLAQRLIATTSLPPDLLFYPYKHVQLTHIGAATFLHFIPNRHQNDPSLRNPQQLSRIIRNQLLRRETQFLQLLRIWRGDLSARDARRGSLQIIKCILAGKRHDLGRDAERWESRLDAQHVAGLLDGFDDSLNVEGLDGAQVDDFGIDAVLFLQELGGNEGLADAAGEGDHCEVFSWAFDFGFAELL